MLSANLSVLCCLASSPYPAEMLPPVVTHWGSLRTEMPQLLVLMHGVKSCTRWKWSNSELFFSAAAFSILMSPLRHPCLSVVICACCSSFTGTELQATVVIIIKASKNYTWIICSGPFQKKMTQILEIVHRPCQEENSLFVPTSVQNKVGMVTLVNSTLEPSRSESERPTVTETFFGKHNFEYTFTYLPYDSVYPTIWGQRWCLDFTPGKADFNCIYQAFFVKSLLQQLKFEACVDRTTPGSKGISLMCSDNFVV